MKEKSIWSFLCSTILLLLLSSCRNEEVLSSKHREESGIAKTISYNQLLKDLGDGNNFNIISSLKGSSIDEDFTIVQDKIIYTSDSLYEYFSMRMKPSHQIDRRIFYNLFVKKSKEDQKIYQTVIKFSPSMETLLSGYKTFRAEYEVLASNYPVPIVQGGFKGRNCGEVSVEYLCANGYLHSQNGPGPWCDVGGSYAFSFELCAETGNGDSNGGGGMMDGSDNSGNNNPGGGGSSGSNVIVTPSIDDVGLCDIAATDQFITSLYYTNQAWANTHISDFNALTAGLCMDGSFQNRDFTSWAIHFLSQNSNVSSEQFQNWFIDGYSDDFKFKLRQLSSIELQAYAAINQENDTSPYEEEYIKETNEAYVAFAAYADIETMTDAQIEYVLNNNCCAGLFIQQQINEKTHLVVANYRALRLIYPNWSKAKCLWEASRETIQLLLDIGGVFPLVGEICDISNGIIYTMNGDQLNAALSYSSAIPIAGWGATAAKFAVKKVVLTSGGTIALAMIKRSDNVITFGSRGNLRKVLGLVKGDLRQAHHVIPWGKSGHPAIQKAANFKFHMNDALNGIPIAAWRNQPNHFSYDVKVVQKLDQIMAANPTPQQAYIEISNLISDIKTAILNNPNTHLNNLSF